MTDSYAAKPILNLPDWINMQPRYFSAPRDEKWIFEDLTVWLAQRLAAGYFGEPDQQGLTRLLYGLQRFPRMSEELNITLSWLDDPDIPCGVNDDLYRESIRSIQYSQEGLILSTGHTFLGYFEGSYYVRSGYEILTGPERQIYLKGWLPEFSELSEPSTPVSVEDHSRTGEVDNPPLSAFWDPNIRILTDVLDDRLA